MSLNQSKILLDKINALHKSISIEGENISAIERDLMLSYIRQFYEQFLKIETETSNTPTKRKSIKAPKPVPIPPQEAVYAPPKRVKIPDSIKELEKEMLVPPPPKAEPKPIIPKKIALEIVPPPPPPPKPAPTPAKAVSFGRFKGLFSNNKAADLSEKLSLQPLKDLSKAIAINDKLLYVNDLFDKDSATFSIALKNLNAFNNMEEAQSVLLDYAKQFNWMDEEKEDTARSFIKLVKRRYI